jgi:NADH dehydrogenase FAD-containing subunit
MEVVIVGGGFCGSMVAKKLDKHRDLQIKLINKNNYFEFSPGLPKVIIKPKYHQRIIVPYSRFLKHTKIVTDSLIQINSKFVETEKEKINFDYLVISTGIDYPIFLQNKQNVFTIKSGIIVKEMCEQIKKAKKILIVGGGVIGTEVAGELATKTSDKKMILVHPHNRLLERNSEFASYFAQRFLERHGVQIIFGEKVQEHNNKIFITDKKRKIEADIAIWCAGIKCNPWYMKSFPESIYTQRRALKVNSFLQLDGYSNIFVGGDITSIQEEKTGHNAERHARVISKNILLMNQNDSLIPHKKGISMMDISLGKWDGIIAIPPLILPGIFPGIAKWVVEMIGVGRLK